MPHHQWRKCIASAAYPRYLGPDFQSLLKPFGRLHLGRAIAGQVGVSPVDSESESSQDMGCNREGNEEWLERERLVDWSCEEEVLFRGRD